MDRMIRITRLPPNRYRVFFEGTEIGIWKDPECSAARWLLNKGRADRGDVLRVYRGETPFMKGSVGWFADRRVSETEKTSPTFVKWTPFPDARRQPGTASDTSGVG
jgi:hypothetical protein